MASIISRNDKFIVVCSYYDEEGVRKQKWESFETMDEARARKIEIEYSQQMGTFKVPTCKTLVELLDEYVSLYGKTKWSISAYTSNTSLIKHYIVPIIGNMRLNEITPRTLEKYYQKLLGKVNYVLSVEKQNAAFKKYKKWLLNNREQFF